MDGWIDTRTAPEALAAFDLSGRTALVTGARRGIGRAIAEALAGQGARLALHHAGEPEEEMDASGVEQRIRARGGEARCFAADFRRAGSGAALGAEVLSRVGAVDILVLNASIELHEDLGAVTPAGMAAQVAVNLVEPLALLQALLPAMRARGWGRILAIGSTQQCRPSPRKLVYAATKAAQRNMVLGIARELGPEGITANNLAPGVIATPRNAVQVAAERARLLAGIPARRIGTPADLVGAALLLCSDAGSYINGVNLWVDGGRHAG